MKFLNRLLYQVHRWVGLVLALFMFIWFVSGLVIMYAPSITQSRGQQWAHAETLNPEITWLSLGEVWERSAEQRNKLADKAKAKQESSNAAKAESPPAILDARLVRSAGNPLWLIEDSKGQKFALSALDASLHETSREEALQIAANWYLQNNSNNAANPLYIDTVDSPIILRNQDALKPFYKIGVGNDGGELLISKRTGEVLHASNSYSRAFYYAGNWIHLFKPLDSLGWGSIRHDTQLWLGFAATVACLTGLIIGWLRWRPGYFGKKTYSEGRTQPYREFWFKWHFWTGLIGGSAALFWALSGYISTNPGKLFSQTAPSRQELSRFYGNELPESMRVWQPTLPLDLVINADGSDIVELNWRRIGEQAVLLASTRDGKRLTQTLAGVKKSFDNAALQAAVERIDPKTPISSVLQLDQYDNYYYPRHNQGLIERPLPVAVIRLADDKGTRYYLDPADGKILSKTDRSARLFRWLYSALHHWDFGWLHLRPIWDVWMLAWVGFGIVLGGSSLVIGWRLLKKTFKVKKRPEPQIAETRYGKLKVLSKLQAKDALVSRHLPVAKSNMK